MEASCGIPRTWCTVRSHICQDHEAASKRGSPAVPPRVCEAAGLWIWPWHWNGKEQEGFSILGGKKALPSHNPTQWSDGCQHTNGFLTLWSKKLFPFFKKSWVCPWSLCPAGCRKILMMDATCFAQISHQWKTQKEIYLGCTKAVDGFWYWRLWLLSCNVSAGKSKAKIL